jgi:hypothetical protein
LTLKKYLANRDCDKSYSGGISSFLLFYLVLAYFQNYSAKYNEENPNVPDIYKFIEFYANFDESKYGLQIDLSEIFPEDAIYKNKSVGTFPKIIEVNRLTHKNVNLENEESLLFMKDPIGKIYYSDPSDYHLFRENIAQSAFNYQKVKNHFQMSYKKLNESKEANFKEFIQFTHSITPSVDQFVQEHAAVWEDDDIKLTNEEQIETPVKSVYEMNVDEIEEILDDKQSITPVKHVLIEPELKQIKILEFGANDQTPDTNSDVMIVEEGHEILKIKTLKNQRLIYCSSKDRNEVNMVFKKKKIGSSRVSKKRK